MAGAERVTGRHRHLAGLVFVILMLYFMVSAPQERAGQNIGGTDAGNSGGGVRAENYCTPESRNAEVCMSLYKPVCGWFDAEKIRCFRYPCAANYPNSCVACTDEKVAYWTEGECPK
ncbi:MAG: hypothetical protein V1676_04100 [Candidatus Diapherotrites archaeon]